MFAVPPVFDGGGYPATAIAMEATKLLLIERKDFLALLHDSSEFSFAVIQWMCSMLREKTATIQNLATVVAGTSRRQHHSAAIGRQKVRATNRSKYCSGGRILPEWRAYYRNHYQGGPPLADKNLITITHGKIFVDATEPLAAPSCE